MGKVIKFAVINKSCDETKIWVIAHRCGIFLIDKSTPWNMHLLSSDIEKRKCKYCKKEIPKQVLAQYMLIKIK